MRRLAGRAFRGIVRHLPSLAAFGARRAGEFMFRRGTERHAQMTRNLRAAFPERSAQELETLIRASARSTTQYMIEQLQLDYTPPAELAAFARRSTTFAGLEHLEAALDSPKPVVVYTPHYSNFAMACLLLVLQASKKKSVSIFFNPPEKNPYAPRMRRLIENLDCDAQALHNDRGGLLKAFRALHKGGLIGIMPDVFDYEAGTILVPFFGRFAFAMTGTAFLARKYDATLLPLYAHRVRTGRFEVRFDAPIEIAHTNDLDADTWHTTAAVFRNMEEHLRRDPAHWMYWDTFLGRVYPNVTVPADAAEWEQSLRTLSRKLWAKSPLAGLIQELDTRRGTIPSEESAA
jgi:KDO2-lipid IV(A) lauroyltransferase